MTDLKKDQNDHPLTENEQIAHRREKLKKIRETQIAFPNDFRRDSLASLLFALYQEKDHGFFESNIINAHLAGRIMTRRLMGKASFLTLQDMSGKIQVYLRCDDLPEGSYEEFKNWDLGDIIGVSGTLFKTKTGELSLKAKNIKLLTKALRPMPEKFHGLTDHETRYRQRYLDLIANPEARQIFQTRSNLINAIRKFFIVHGFLEVETPMMHPIPGGATARPFITHHNTLDMELYLRIAPELYLKKLVVGGLERVFEINRSFRNEGISIQHNPEFTMLEFYQAYANYHELMNFTENLLATISKEILGKTKITYQGEEFDFGVPFERLSLKNAILLYNPQIKKEDLENLNSLKQIAQKLEIQLDKDSNKGKILTEIFEKTVEKKLRQPTFIVEYPIESSPLARRNNENPEIADRFEFFVAGREIANGFSELNDPEDQASRFKEQTEAKNKGDQEAMHFDSDYITALEYGLPPTAGEGIGIDRLTMLFTDAPSIRDVILFPLLRNRSEK